MDELKLIEVEVSKITLNTGDVLSITIKSDNIDTYSLNSLRNSLKTVFPNNRVMLFNVSSSDKIEFSVVSNESTKNYCSDCSCGKKESYEVKPLPVNKELMDQLPSEGEENESNS